MIIQDFSNWDRSLFDHSIQLITYKDIISINSNGEVSLSEHYEDNQKLLIESPSEVHLFWVSLGIGVENLLKSIFIKHQVLRIEKNEAIIKVEPSAPKKFQDIYSYVTSIGISASSNLWLQTEFDRLDINNPFEIKTNTLWNLCTIELKDMLNLSKITQTEYDEICNSMNVLRLMRRNIDAHSFLKNRVVGSMNGDLENIYVPMIDLLIKIYNR